MRVLFVGGTGFISTEVSQLALARGIDLVHLNRGRRRGTEVEGVRTLVADYHDPRSVEQALGSERFDAVVNWIAYVPADVERDILLIGPRTKQ